MIEWLTSIKSVVDQVFQIFTHAHLSHQFVFVPIHSCQLADMGEYVLQAVSQLERIHVAQAVLNMGVNNKLCQT